MYERIFPLIVISSFLIIFILLYIFYDIYKLNKKKADVTTPEKPKQICDKNNSNNNKEEITKNNKTGTQINHTSQHSSNCQTSCSSSSKRRDKHGRKRNKPAVSQKDVANKTESHPSNKDGALIPTKIKKEQRRYVDLAISKGRLIPWSLGKTKYYQCWEYNNKIYYQLYPYSSQLDKDKIINNHSSTIDPFCNIAKGSCPWDVAKSINTVSDGLLDDSYNIIEKITIKLV